MVGIRVSLLFMSVFSVVFAQDKPGCEITCRDAMTGPQAAGLGCPAGDAACLCKNPEFHNGVRDCIAKSCAPNLIDGAIADINNTFCGAAALPPPAATPTPTPTQAPAPTSSVSSATPPPAETSTPPAAQTPTTTPASSSTTTPAPAPTSSLTSASPLASSSTTSSGTKNPAATTAPPAPTKSAAPEETGLSAGAKIGIGIGAAVAIVGLIGLLACVYFLRRKGGRSALSMHISDPLPGSGRIFAKDLPAQRPFRTDLGMTELELRSHPYEKMVPQQEPRTMV